MTALHPPGPAGAALLRTMVAYGRDPFPTLLRLSRRYGDIVQFAPAPINAVLINRPDLIEDVLVTRNWNFVPLRPFAVNQSMHQGLFTSQGYLHMHQRRLLQPLYEPEHVVRWGNDIARVAGRLGSLWRSGEVRDIEHEMVRLTVFMSAAILFGDDAQTHARELVFPAIPVNQYLGTRSTNPLSAILELVPVQAAGRRFRRAMDALDAGLYRRINARRAEGRDRGDLLSTLLQTRDTDDGLGLSDRQIRDELITNYTTGNAVVASGLLWTWYLLAQNPDAEARLHAELEAVLAGRAPAIADLPKLRYTEKVVMESMRIYPPAWTIGRRALQDYEADGYLVPAGSSVLVSPYVTQRDTRHFPNPKLFDPERWTPEARAERPPFSYFPFSGGPRGCLGEHLAWTEMLLAIATLAQNWQLRCVSSHPIQLRPLIALRPKDGLPMRLTQRG